MNSAGFSSLLRRRGFAFLLVAQGLAVFNDHALKAVFSFYLLRRLSQQQAPTWIALASGLYILPFVLFSSYAGQVADRFSKRRVIIGVKLAEIVVLLAALGALRLGNPHLLLGILFLMGLHSTFLSPAKLGILAEFLPEEALSRANGLMELTVFTSIILGSVAGGLLFARSPEAPFAPVAVLAVVAAAATVASLGIARVAAAGPGRVFRWNFAAEFWSSFGAIRAWRPMMLTVTGIAYFWFLGTIYLINVLSYGRLLMHLSDANLALLNAAVSLGIGMGAMAAGKLSGDRAELGLPPLGSIGLGVLAIVLAFAHQAVPDHRLFLVMAGHLLLGFSGGVFIVPLNTFLQQHAEAGSRGRIIAASNVLTFLATFLGSGMIYLLSGPLALRPDTVLLVVGLCTFAGTAYILHLLPDAAVRLCLWLLTHTFYRIRVRGKENLPRRGGALLVCNHMSYVDPFLIGACTARYVRFLMYRSFYEIPGVHWLAKLMGAIPIAPQDSPRDLLSSLRHAQQQMEKGELVCIFAEGSITRIGNLLPFRKGLERLTRHTKIPIIPLQLDRVWGSIFSFERGRFFFKWPRRIPYPVTVTIGRPLAATARAFEVRQAVMDLGADAMAERVEERRPLPELFLNTACRNRRRFAMADSTGAKMNFASALAGALLFRRLIRDQCFGQDLVGVLLPPSVPAALLNLGIALAGKTAVNLNYTASQEVMQLSINRAGLKTIYSSKKFLERLKMEPRPDMVLLEEVRAGITPLQKAFYGALVWAVPRSLLRRLFPDRRTSLDDLATVIFSSGSTGVPKAVMLTHANILANVEGLQQTLHLDRNDRLLGVLPFFHSFGFTGALWMPLLSGFGAVYHFNPLDAKTVGELAQKHGATILIGTPTFYQAYLARVTKEQFSTLRLALAGAEKLRPQLAEAFHEKFGLDLLEGYGCTELSPVVSISVPSYVRRGEKQIGAKPGTIGQPLPGVSVRIVDPETWEPRPAGEEGMLLVRGANVMKGYMGQPEKTAEVMRDGWYVTGDIARLDEDGFLTITDRLSRFSKIGGEMVPHLRVEEALHEALGATELKFVVTSLPDEQKGERLVVLHLDLELPVEELLERLRGRGLPNLWIPRKENFVRVEAFPILGSGKLDQQKARLLAAN